MVAPYLKTKAWPYSRQLYIAVALAAVSITALTFQVAVTSHDPSHSALALTAIKMTVVLPEIGIWFLAAISALRFKNYANSIKQASDGKNLNYIADGLLWLLAYVVDLCITSPVQSLLLTSEHAQLWRTLTNHVPIIPALVASICVFRGARGLASLTRSEFWTRRHVLLVLVPFCVFMAAFVLNFYNQAPHLRDVDGILRFALPVNTLLITYVVPHLIIWALVLAASVNLWWYAKRVDGTIYKALFLRTQRGLVIVFIAIFLAQLLICSPYASENFQLGIGLVYAVLLLTILGYTLIYKGSRQLQNIEEIV